MKKLFIAIALTLCALDLAAQDFSGKWYGRAQLGAQALRIDFEMRNTDGAWSGAMQSPDQSAQWIPMSGVAVTGYTLSMTIASIDFSYTGRLDGGNIRGSFTQFGNTYPLDLTRTAITVNRPQEPRPPYSYTVEEVKFKNAAAGITLAGTLTTPPGGERCPFVIMVSGSGPQDRDENISGHRPFAVIADFLTRSGIAVLRYDDRGVGTSEGNFASAAIADFATDAAAAVDYVRGRTAAPVGIVGHARVAWLPGC